MTMTLFFISSAIYLAVSLNKVVFPTPGGPNNSNDLDLAPMASEKHLFRV